MPVKLRLRRLGRRKRPAWAVVAADNRKSRDGRYIEDLGRYYPLEQPSRVQLDEGRVMHWLEQGAQPSDTVRSMLSKRGLMLALDLRRQGKDLAEIEAAVSEHREKHGEGAGEAVSLTAEARRQQALEAERERVAELEAEEEQRRKEEEERKRREAEAKKKEEEEAAAAAEEEEDDAVAAVTEDDAEEAEASAEEDTDDSSEDAEEEESGSVTETAANAAAGAVASAADTVSDAADAVSEAVQGEENAEEDAADEEDEDEEA